MSAARGGHTQGATLPLTYEARKHAGAGAGPALAVGSIWVGRFQIRRALGSGASATVFEALDLHSHREVALKVLRSRHPNALARFKMEFRTLQQIAHPNLVAMHELWVDEGQCGFISMDVIRGHGFLEHVRPERFARRDDARLRSALEQLVRGAQYLHAHRCLHRDLKPSNVLVSDAGQLVIVDFGLAQSSCEAAALGDATFEGTPAYAAPEQLDARQVTEASDWYAIGGMLYEALCGERPFAGYGPDLLMRKAATDPPLPSRRTHEPVPPALERVCMRLLARAPEDRARGQDVLAVLGTDSHVPELRPNGDDSVFAGRTTELAWLERWLERAHARGGALAITGDSGIGKTTLSSRFSASLRADARVRVLSGRCFVQEALPYNAFDGIVEDLAHQLRQLPDCARAAILPTDHASLARLFPALLRVVPAMITTAPEQPVTGYDAQVERARAFRALRQLLNRLTAYSPVLLYVEDLQWADEDSLALLRELLAEPIPQVALLVTVRADAASMPLLAACEQLALGPLEEAAVALLAREQLAGCTVELARAIARESAGHPLLACELIAHLRQATAPSEPRAVGLAAAQRARLSLLSRPARAALRLACVAGQPVPRRCLLDLGPTHGVELAVLRELRVARALRETIRDGELLVEPYHDSIRQLVAAELEPKLERRLHMRLARGMLALGERYLERAVHHYVRAGRWQRAARLAERAAEHAMEGLALHRAADLLELALRSVDCDSARERLQLVAAAACTRAGRILAAAQHYEQAAERACGARRAELQLQALSAYYTSGHSARGRAVLEALATESSISLEPRPITIARGVVELIIMLFTGLPYLRKPHSALLPASRDERSAAALRVFWGAAAVVASVDGAAAGQFAARALALSARQGDGAVYGQALAFHLTVFPLLLNRRSRLVERRLHNARQLARTSGDFWDDAYVRMAQGSSALLSSDYVSTLDACLEIAQIPQLRTPFSANVRGSARMLSVLALYWLGRITQLSELSHAWLEDAIDCGDRKLEFAFRTMRCYAHLQRDRADQAVLEIERARALELDYVQGGRSDPWWFAGVAQYRGEAEQAAALCAEGYAHYDVYARYTASARTEWNLALGGSAAALAVRGVNRSENLRQLRRQAREASWGWGRMAKPTAAQLWAADAALTGRDDLAIARLTRTAAAYDALGMRLHAASARLVLSRRLQSESTRRALEQAALTVFRAERIARPDRWTRVLMPGFSDGEC